MVVTRQSRFRRGLALVLAVPAVLAVVATGVLFVVRFVPPDAFAASPDTQAMVVAFTDLSVLVGAGALVLALLALVLRRSRGTAVVAALGVLALAVPAIAVGTRWSASPASGSSRTFTVLELNGELGQADAAATTRAASSADVVVLTELTSPQLRRLETAGFTRRFPHATTGDLPGAGAIGTKVFSRYPLSSTAAVSEDLSLQAWTCSVDLPGVRAPLSVTAVHPGRPQLGGNRWLPEQDDVRTNLPTSGLRLLAGDFNAVDSHPTMRAIREAGWRSSVDEAGAGWVPTYPADISWLPPLIDIDHVYLAGGLQATHVQSVRVPGTDHLGLLVTVEVTDPR